MEKIDEHFLRSLDAGSRIFKFKKDTDDYILYTVVSTKHADQIELMNIFDENENTLKISIKELLTANCWFYNPEF